MDPDNSPNPDDHGLNMDTVPASHDDFRSNLDSVPATFDDPGIQIGQSSSQTSSTSAISEGPLFCINCNINVTRLRRHVLEIAEVQSVVQRWLRSEQVLVTNDTLLCHLCWTAAWNQIRNPTNEQTRFVAHQHVCIICGRSLLRTRSHSLGSDSSRGDVIRTLIARQIAPRQLPRSAEVCHTCWRRSERAVSRVSEPENLPSVEPTDANELEAEEHESNTSDNILLPNYIRAPATENSCFFPNCNQRERLVVPSELRVNLFCNYNYYVPKNCRICSYHLISNLWDSLLELIENPIKTFNANQIEDFASLLKDNMYKHLDLHDIASMPEHIVQYYLGVTKEKFQQLLFEVPRLANKHKGAFALAAYLMKLRTGDSDNRMSALLQVPRSTLERYFKMAREILCADFVSMHLGLSHISRAEIAQRNLVIPNGLFGGENNQPIIIADGTYVYIEKSSNYLYQKKTYSLHKYRNLVKPFLFVCADGYIIDIFGPYPATTSDADIINKEFGQNISPCRQYFQPGDIFILDRGFRDSLSLLENCGYHVHVPLSVRTGETQLSTIDANMSRAVTMCRWVVEVVNGIFKTAFKIFRQNYFNRASTHLMQDFSVAAALINKYHTKITDRPDAAQILATVNRNMLVHNDLADYVRERNLNRTRADFININVNGENVREFPILTHADLVLIACGTYQIKQACSYYGEHIRFNGCYRIEVCNNHRISLTEGNNFGPSCFLLRARISSRHINRKIYFVYLLVDGNDSGINAIKKYCCNCVVGCRTVGCCAHVMTVIWYLGWARHQSNIYPPAQYLDNVLIVYDIE